MLNGQRLARATSHIVFVAIANYSLVVKHDYYRCIIRSVRIVHKERGRTIRTSMVIAVATTRPTICVYRSYTVRDDCVRVRAGHLL